MITSDFGFWGGVKRWVVGFRERRNARERDQKLILEQWQLKAKNDRIKKQKEEEEPWRALGKQLRDALQDIIDE